MITKSNKLVRPKRARRLLVMVSAIVVAAVLAANSGLVGLAQTLALPQAEPSQPDPLTDMAPPAPAVDVTAGESPQVRMEALGLDKPLPADQGKQPSDVMDLAHPPAWTRPMVEPSGKPPVPPDPFTAPPLIVNVERSPQSPAEPSRLAESPQQ